MRPLLAVFLLLACYSCRAQSVADVLLRERLRIEPARATGAQRIESATERFLNYYPLARSPADVHRLDHAFRKYNQRVLREMRQRLQHAIESTRERWQGPEERAGITRDDGLIVHHMSDWGSR